MQEWTTPQWREEVLAWTTEQGVTPTGEAEQTKLSPWSTVLRIPYPDGFAFFKAGGPGTGYEAGLLQALAEYGTPHVLTPLALDPVRGWILLPDGGPTLRDLHGRDKDLRHWERVLPKYAETQRHLENRELPGAEDHRPEQLPALFEALLEELEVGPRAELEALRTKLDQWCAELAASGIIPTAQHDDLHDNNVFTSRGHDLVYDWGDASLAFPFSSLLVTLRSVASSFDLAPGAPELERLRDAYLESWTDTHSRAELELLALLATRVGKISRSRAWQRALTGVDSPEHAEAPPGWLEELLEPDVF
ncbi:MAG: hypothetical protein JWO12_129 [Frankiales bacterium]|nr:hypothetical protein [Frankiales bacterium]